MAAVLAFALSLVAITAGGSDAGAPQDGARPSKESAPTRADHRPAGRDARSGVLVNDPRAFQGHTLLAPMDSRMTYLIDMQGRVVHTWKSEHRAGLVAYFLENGHLLRSSRPFGGSSASDRAQGVQEFTWEGVPVWDFTFNHPGQTRHHDICKLPNGNVLMIVNEKKSAREVVAAGGKEAEGITLDCILEVQPTGKATGKVVWEWHIWDHLIQDHDKSKANYGDVAAHPELLDINFWDEDLRASFFKKKDIMAKLRDIGYTGPPPPGMAVAPGDIAEWTHANSVAYNAELDQVMVTVHHFSEFWVIDHGTTTAQAAGHSGGRRGKGGDLLYRWGNPRAYHAGTAKDQQLFFPHDAHWIPRGYPGEGHVLVFNNGYLRPAGDYSSVDEIALPADGQGVYERKPGAAFGPGRPAWSYTAPRKEDFYSSHTAGANRLPNGDTLICSTMQGTVFEVTPDKEVVWKYQLPMPPAVSRVTRFQNKLRVLLSPSQTKQMKELQKATFMKLIKSLTPEQKVQLKEVQGELGELALISLLLQPSLEGRLKLTPDQQQRGARLAKEANAQLDTILKPQQRENLQKMVTALPPRTAVPALAVFRAYRYAPTYPGLAGKDLTPRRTLEQMQAQSK
jgi:hypothetical protein